MKKTGARERSPQGLVVANGFAVRRPRLIPCRRSATGKNRPTADIRNSNEHRQQSRIVSVSIRNYNSIYLRECTPPWTEEMANNNQMTISRYTAILAEYDLI